MRVILARMLGISGETGRPIDGVDHLRQSVTDILRTPIGSRVLRRDYGSRLFELIDAPANQSSLMDFYAATVDALARWEPRMRVDKVNASMPEPGRLLLAVEGVYLPDGSAVRIEGIEVR